MKEGDLITKVGVLTQRSVFLRIYLLLNLLTINIKLLPINQLFVYIYYIIIK